MPLLCLHSKDNSRWLSGRSHIILNFILQYRVRGSTPEFRTLQPLASPSGSVLAIGGSFRATGFQDADDPKDPDSTDRDDEGDDFFTRILVGGRGCSTMREDGSL